MKRFGIVFFHTLVVFGLYSQSKAIRGTVCDARYKTPVAYAAVFLQHTTFGTVADNVGKFTFTAPDSLLKNGRLVVSREGFELAYFPLENINTSDLQIALQPGNYTDETAAMFNRLRQHTNPLRRFLGNTAKWVIDDYIPLGNAETNKFDFGRIQTIPTYNSIEGVRLRAGLVSNARLSPHFFVRGYAAYGFRDRKLKHRSEVIWSFDRKAYHEDEFPKNNLRLVYETDLYSPGEMHPMAQNDQLLSTFRRSAGESMYRTFAETGYEREYKNGLTHTFWVRKSTLVPQANAAFRHKTLKTSEVGLLLRYSVREAYVQQKRKRIPIETTSPVFFLSHSVGIKGFLGGEAAYHRTDFSVQKRFLLREIGRLDVAGEMAKVWNSVPFPLLVYPNQRYKHHIESNAFFLNRALEFVADEQYTFRATFVGDDFLLAKVPLLRDLGIRELISLRASYGKLSAKNDPSRSFSPIYDFPAVSYRYGAAPYIEATIGLTNILGILRVEYVHRFTYRDHVGALLGEVQIDVTL